MNQPKLTVKLLLFLLLAGAILATYSNHFHNAFHFDDSHTIENNLYLRELSNIPLFFTDGTTFSSLPSNQSYRPLLSTSLAIDYALQGNLQDTFWFHFSSFLFFLLQALPMLLLYHSLLRDKVGGTSSWYIALAAVAWYMLHPVNAETVNYLIQRGDSLSTFFVFCGFAIYLSWPAGRKFYLYLLPVAAGALTKPTAIMFAPLLMWYQWLEEENAGMITIWKEGRFFRLLRRNLIPLAACIGLFLFTRAMEPDTWTPGGNSGLQYMFTQPYVFYHYVKMFFYPYQLSADTDLQAFDPAQPDGRLLGGFIFLAALILLAIFSSEFKRLRPIAFGIGWFLLALLPTSVVPLAEVMNDHRMFFPFAGMAISIIWGAYLALEWLMQRFAFIPWKWAGLLCGLSLLSFYARGTYLRNEVWKTEESLWKDVSIKSPKNGRGLMNYGLALMRRGDYDGAEHYFREGLKLWPYYSYLYVNMAIVLNVKGKYAEAEAHYLKGIQYGSSLPNSYTFYGEFLKGRKRYSEALLQAEKALQLSAAHIDAGHLAMDACYELQDFGKLKSFAESTLSIYPADPIAQKYLSMAQSGKNKFEAMEALARQSGKTDDWLNLSLAYYLEKRYSESLQAADEALKTNPQSAEAHNNRCSALNMLGRYAEGASACREALRLKPDFALAANNLKWAESNLPKP